MGIAQKSRYYLSCFSKEKCCQCGVVKIKFKLVEIDKELYCSQECFVAKFRKESTEDAIKWNNNGEKRGNKNV